MTQFFVNSASGNDANSGTQETTPFKTITHALSLVKAGDRVQLAKGTYNAASGETFPLKLRAGVCLIGNEAKKGEGVLIEGGGAYKSQSDARLDFNVTVALLLKGQEAAELRGLTLANINKRGSAIWIEAPTPIAPIVACCSIQKCDMEGIFVAGAASPTITATNITDNPGYGICLVDKASGAITENHFEKNAVGIKVGAETKDQAAPQIAKNTISRNTRSGLIIGGSCCPSLQGNVIEQNLNDGLVVIDQALPNLGTSNSPGGNLLRGNCWYDLESTTSTTLTLVGNTIDPARCKGKVQFQNNQLPSPLPCPAVFTLSGHVIDQDSHQALDNLRVEVIFKDSTQTIHTATGLTNATGNFSVPFDLSLFKGGCTPRVSFKIYRDTTELSTSAAIEQLQPANQHIEIEVAPPVEPLLCTVTGRVMEVDGTPIASVTVRAFDICLSQETHLGESKTNPQGTYKITYRAQLFLDQGKQRPDLDLRVVNNKGETIAWLPNAPLFNARNDETINLVRGGHSYLGPTAFHQSMEALRPALQRADLASLQASGVNWLIGKTGQNPGEVVELAKASRMAKSTGQPSSLFYALFKGGLPQTIPQLIGQSPANIRFALRQAAQRNLISTTDLDQQADALLASFQTMAVDLAMEAPTDPNRLSLGTLLQTALPDEPLCRRFLSAYAAHSGPIQAFWQAMTQDKDLGSHVASLQLTLQLGALSVNHQPMLKKLQTLRANGTITTFADLTAFSESDWHNLITTEDIGAPPQVPGKNDSERARNYARVMSDMVEQAFPSAFVAARLQSGDPLQSFLKNHPGFDLKATQIGPFLKESNVHLEPSALDRLRAMQRVYRLAPRWRAAVVLLDHRLDSAYRIGRVGKNVFVKRYQDLLGPKEARNVYERAHQVHAMGLQLLSQAGLIPAGTSMAVLDDAPIDRIPADTTRVALADSTTVGVSGDMPDWQTLFQDAQELCECEHCRSVLGPAAYLVDVLQFLDDRSASETAPSSPHRSAKDVLFEHRPDLGGIELSCENTSIPIPYVDLVNEILEDAVAPASPFTPFTLAQPAESPSLEESLNARRLSVQLRALFNQAGSPLDPTAEIRGVDPSWSASTPPTCWTIDDLRFSYCIRKQEEGLKVVTRSRQTRGSTAERRAMPQYVNPDAYTQLRMQKEAPWKPMVYPWSLPFDLDAHTIRIHLAHQHSSRRQILDAFLPGQRKDILSHHESVIETLGLSAEDAVLICDSQVSSAQTPWQPSQEPWTLWGFANESLCGETPIPDPADSMGWIDSGHWLATIAGRVDIFLRQSGLSYRELLELLGTDYVNPRAKNSGRLISIHAAEGTEPTTCDTSELWLHGLDEPAALRIVRFVRLWRRLGWTIRELDGAITALASQDIDEAFLRNLSGLARVRQRLALPLERLLPFWAPISTAVYIDHDAPGQPSRPSQYERMFRNRAVIELPDPDFPVDPEDLNGSISTYAATVAAGLEISVADLQVWLHHFPQLAPASAQQSPAMDEAVELNLANLSLLYRHATLAKALRRSVNDYLLLLALHGDDPFQSATGSTPVSDPLVTLLFVEAADELQHSGFTLRELGYLLRHCPTCATALAPKEREIAALLQTIRMGLRLMKEQNSFSTDPSDPRGVTVDANGELTRQKLGLLEWDSTRIDLIVATLNDTVTYVATLNSLPEEAKIPPALTRKIEYDINTKQLTCQGILLQAERDELIQLSQHTDGESEYHKAIFALFNAPRDVLKLHLRAFSVPDFSTKLEALPEALSIPGDLREKLYHDPVNKRLHFKGVMTLEQRDTLVALCPGSGDCAKDCAKAVGELYAKQLEPPAQGPEAWPQSEEDCFFKPDAIEVLVDPNGAATQVPQRFCALLAKLLPYLQSTLSKRLIIQQFATALSIEIPSCERLMTHWLKGNDNSHPHAIDVFLDPAFAQSHPLLPITTDAFPAQFQTFVLLDKVGLVISRLNLSLAQLGWLFELAASPWPNLDTLPLTSASPAQDLKAWRHLWQLCQLCESLDPSGSLPGEWLTLIHSLPDSLTTEEKNNTKTKAIQLLINTVGWSPETLQILLGNQGESSDEGILDAAFPEDYRGEHLLYRLQACQHLQAELGLPAQLCGALSGPLHALSEPDQGRRLANQVVQAVQKNDEQERWLDIARPLRDELRELQRAGLVAFLVSRPTRKKPWRDVNDLYSWFLIDPEMGSGMMSSRIVQAHSVVQLFVLRCRLNLEPNVSANDAVDVGWRQWSWMKNYRVWEANRKVFLYPENWIEPELRDDKSPFFKELEGDLMQTDVTLASAAKAVLGYLEKLNQVAHLEIVGEYLQSGEVLLSGNRTHDILHVFGRTKAEPPIYYYRRRLQSSYWTPWERVDLPIAGDHLIPVVWNRRLYLFWPVFTEAADVDTNKEYDNTFANLKPQEVIPKSHWEMKLAWSEFLDGKWLPKKVSSSQISWEKSLEPLSPTDLTIRLSMLDPSQLIFAIQGIPKQPNQEFSLRGYGDHKTAWDYVIEDLNNKKVSPDMCAEFKRNGHLLTDDAHVTFLGRNDSEGEGWRGSWSITTNLHEYTIRGQIETDGTLTLNVVISSSFRFSCQIGFIFGEEGTDPVVKALSLPMFCPAGQTKWHRMYMQEDESDQLVLPLPPKDSSETALAVTPSQFFLLPPPDHTALSRSPFFYLDQQRTFFVEGLAKLHHTYRPWNGGLVPIARGRFESRSNLANPLQLHPCEIDHLADRHLFDVASGFTLPESLVTNPLDPPRREFSTEALPCPDPSMTALPFSAPSSHTVSSALEIEGDSLAFSSPLGSTANGWIPSNQDLNIKGLNTWWNGFLPYLCPYTYRFYSFSHPHATTLMRQLQHGNLDDLFQRQLQLHPAAFASKDWQDVDFYKEYQPTNLIDPVYPNSDLAFDLAGDVGSDSSDAYALYNTELFFHIPLLIADRLRQNQRFEEAQKWLHYIFNPTDASALPRPQRYWQTKPFYDRSKEGYRHQQIAHILNLLARSAVTSEANGLTPQEKAELDHWQQSIERWRQDPFQPHLIARMRPVAYQKAVVMIYIENLIAWGDQLFRQDTIESINEATQLYILAAEILGKQPERIPPRASSGAQTYNTLQGTLDAFSNAMVAVEHFIPPATGDSPVGTDEPPRSTPLMLYFCPPRNDKLLGFWDLVADRLFKIRHCMTIEGVVRQLPLFQPPIDPGLLVRAAAAGVDIASVLNDQTGPLPHYRFAAMVQKANELCAELKSLGASLLSSLEKKDAEALALLRAQHESTMLRLVESVKQQQIEEAETNLQALRRSRDEVVGRYLHYQKLLGVKSPQMPAEGQTIAEIPASAYAVMKEEGGLKMINFEQYEMFRMSEANAWIEYAQWAEMAAQVQFLYHIANIHPWGIGFTLDTARAATALASRYRYLSADESNQAARASRQAQLVLRAHDWTLQSNQAAKQIMQIDQQILAAQIRVEIAEKELTNHGKQWEQTRQVEAFLHDKYTNGELYGWMSGQISTLYFQTYQLAFDLAKRAERAFRIELGLNNSNYIQFGHWDGLRKGLMAGEKLALEIKRLEIAYLENHRRDYELTKHVSLLQLNPLALIQLRQTGSCTLSLPEELFDMDGPGHYYRRIKHLSISIPCVTGPYSGVYAKLTLLRNSIRQSPVVASPGSTSSADASNNGGYARQEDDDRFIDGFGGLESIVVSTGDHDSGLFEPNLRDERYLPFENAGVISEWRLQLPANPNPPLNAVAQPCQFDYATISDVVFHLRFTARDGGDALREKAMENLQDLIKQGLTSGCVRFFSVRLDLPDDWARFRSQVSTLRGDERCELKLHLRAEHYPYWSQGLKKEVQTMAALIQSAGEQKQITIYPNAKPSEDLKMDKKEDLLSPSPKFGGLFYGELIAGLPQAPEGEHSLFFASSVAKDISDIWFVVTWTPMR